MRAPIFFTIFFIRGQKIIIDFLKSFHGCCRSVIQPLENTQKRKFFWIYQMLELIPSKKTSFKSLNLEWASDNHFVQEYFHGVSVVSCFVPFSLNSKICENCSKFQFKLISKPKLFRNYRYQFSIKVSIKNSTPQDEDSIETQQVLIVISVAWFSRCSKNTKLFKLSIIKRLSDSIQNIMTLILVRSRIRKLQGIQKNH